MSIRARLSRIEQALSENSAIEMKVTSDDLNHLTDAELDRLEHIVAHVGKITNGESVVFLGPHSDDVRSEISWMIENEAEYLAAVQSFIDGGCL